MEIRFIVPYRRSRTLLLWYSALKQLLWENFMITFINTSNKICKHWIFVQFLLMEVYVHGIVQRSCSLLPVWSTLKQLLWESLPDKFYHRIFADCLLILSYVQGALWKELLTASFIEKFKTTTLGKSHW